MLEIYPIKTDVLVGNHKAVVLSVQIKPGNILYELGYWQDGKWTEAWFNDFMVTSSHAKEKIGYSKKPAV